MRYRITLKYSVIVLLLALSSLSADELDGSGYSYWTDAIGSYSFEFQNGTFHLLESQAIQDQKYSDSVELPGHQGYFARDIFGDYHVELDSGFPVVALDKRKYLVMRSGSSIVQLFEETETEPGPRRVFFGLNEKLLREYVTDNVPIYTAMMKEDIEVSSYLTGQTRSGIRYRPPFDRIRQTGVWAVRNENDGIGEWLKLKCPISDASILINNGFIYPGAMKYFGLNNRVKRAKISYSNVSEEIQLRDSPDPQVVLMKQKIPKDSFVTLTILEVYHGSLYSDTVLSFVGFIPEKLINTSE